MREFHYRWEYQLQASPEALWPLVSNTNRFNRDTGVPAVVSQPNDSARSRNARRRLRLSMLGFPVEWEEQPFEWVRPFRFGVVRHYSKGPVAEMRVLAELTPQPGGKTNLTYDVRAQPKSLLGFIAIPVQVGFLSARSFAAVIRKYDQLAVNSQPPLYRPSRADFAPGGRARLRALGEKLVSQGAAQEIVTRLLEMIERGDDMSLGRIRSHVLANYWGARRRDVLELCLWATRVGLLDLQWGLLCPLCRGATQTSAALKDIHGDVHCDVCNIDFMINFDRSVELTFRPNPSIRRVEAEEFCVGGPQVTPHIVVQQLLQPGTERTLRLPLEAGRYRLRTLGLPGGQPIQVEPGGLSESILRASSSGWAEDDVRLAPISSLRFENATDSEQLFILERTAWSDEAVTAAEVTALQVFRDLFASEALRPGEQISVGSLTVLFTDLRGSTQLYREIGDATAFGRVMNHFDVLRDVIAAEEGAVVKTIGDAVMAVFRRPASALHATLKAQALLASPPGGLQPLMLKAGLHTGPCLAVTLNNRLDYFGSTVNMAARLEGLSTGEDVIITNAVYADPEVAELLSQPDGNLTATPFEVKLKGFDEECFGLWRVASKSKVAAAETGRQN